MDTNAVLYEKMSALYKTINEYLKLLVEFSDSEDLVYRDVLAVACVISRMPPVTEENFRTYCEGCNLNEFIASLEKVLEFMNRTISAHYHINEIAEAMRVANAFQENLDALPASTGEDDAASLADENIMDVEPLDAELSTGVLNSQVAKHIYNELDYFGI